MSLIPESSGITDVPGSINLPTVFARVLIISGLIDFLTIHGVVPILSAFHTSKSFI